MKLLESQEHVLTLYTIPLKAKVLRFIFRNVAVLQPLTLLRNKHLLRYIFKTPILVTRFSLKNLWCLHKLVTIVSLENHGNQMSILKLRNMFSILTSRNQEI